MTGQNGTDRVFRLGDRTPEWMPVEIERDGMSVMLRGYVNGMRCLVSVTAAVDAGSDAYNEFMRIVDDDGAPVLDDQGRPPRKPDPGNQLWRARIADMLCAVVPGLTPDEGQVIANTYEDAMALLVKLKWFAPRAEADAAPEVPGEAAPESPSSPSTGDGSSLASTSTTAPETGAA